MHPVAAGPVAFAAARGEFDFGRICTQLDQVSPSRAWLVAVAALRPAGMAVSLRSAPLLPIIETHSAPDPFRQFQHNCVGVTDAEVVDPPSDLEPLPRTPIWKPWKEQDLSGAARLLARLTTNLCLFSANRIRLAITR